SAVSFGGHEKVLSGVCTPESFGDLVAAIDELGQKVEKRSRGSWAQGPKPSTTGVRARMASPQRLRDVQAQARMLAPVANDNLPVTVSVAARAVAIGEPHGGTTTRPATVQLLDGSTCDVELSGDCSPVLLSGATF